MKRTGAVILAAGASTRLQEPKQLVMLRTENLLEGSVRTAIAADYSPVVVVLGAWAELVRASCKLDGCYIVVNENWFEGMGSSIRSGVAALREVDGAVIMTCDMPAVTADHLITLSVTGDVTASCYAGRRGVPAYFPGSMFPKLMGLQRDFGASELLQSARCVELKNGELDVDTIEDLESARRLFG